MNKLATFTSLPNIHQKSDKGILPIRCITYKKKAQDAPITTEPIQQINNFYSEGPRHIGSDKLNSVAFRSSDDLRKTARDFAKPHITIEPHKLTFGRKMKVMTARDTFTSQIKSPTTDKNLSPIDFQSRRISHNNLTEPGDYFDLLRDENRKPFKGNDYDEVDEYYTNEIVMSRIYNQGFRDSAYYSKAVNFEKLKIPEEKVIKEKYMLKIPSRIDEMENEKIIVAHVLGGTTNNISYVEDVVKMAKDALNNMMQKKIELKQEIEDLKTNFNKGIETLMQELPRRMKEVEDRVQNDVVGKQTGGFKMQKELVLLRRDKMTLEKEIEECVEKINKLEDSLYGKRIFDLEAADKGLDNISDLNLRSDRFALMKNSQLLH